MSRKIFNFKKYDLTITCELDAKHGISGHIFEMIEYFYYFRFWHNVNCCIFIPFEFSVLQFQTCLEKYNFSKEELQIFLENLYICKDPKIIDMNIGLFVDGSMFSKGFHGLIKSTKNIFLRCNQSTTFEKADVILQDSRLYEDLPNSSHYVKKILFDKFKPLKSSVSNTAMIYATTNCRETNLKLLEQIQAKFNFEKYIVLSNSVFEVPKKFQLLQVPVKNIFEKFNTYIYTPIEKYKCTVIDCSPRFVAECKFFNKPVIFEIPYIYRGLNVRKFDVENHFESLFLKPEDPIINFL